MASAFIVGARRPRAQLKTSERDLIASPAGAWPDNMRDRGRAANVRAELERPIGREPAARLGSKRFRHQLRAE